jgi:hypothetical protein
MRGSVRVQKCTPPVRKVHPEAARGTWGVSRLSDAFFRAGDAAGSRTRTSVGFAGRRPHRREPRLGDMRSWRDSNPRSPVRRTGEHSTAPHDLDGAGQTRPGSADGIRTRMHRIESPAAVSILPTAPCAPPGTRTRSRPLRRRLLILLSLRRPVPPRGLEPLQSGLEPVPSGASGKCEGALSRAVLLSERPVREAGFEPAPLVLIRHVPRPLGCSRSHLFPSGRRDLNPSYDRGVIACCR